MQHKSGAEARIAALVSMWFDIVCFLFGLSLTIYCFKGHELLVSGFILGNWFQCLIRDYRKLEIQATTSSTEESAEK